jgi:hypothetical protein
MADATAPYAQQFAQSFRAVQQRSVQERLREARDMEQHLEVLASVRKPLVLVYVFLALLAVGLDVLDFIETPTAVTGIAFIIQSLLEIGFFLLIKAMIGRGTTTSLFLIACTLFYMATAAVTSPIFIPLLLVFAFTNRKAHIVQQSKEALVGRLESLDGQIAQYGARVERLARTASQMGRRLGRVSGTVRRARIAGRVRLASRRITKASRTVNRALRNTIGNMLPFIELIPFQLWTVYGTYRDQLNTWQEAQEFLVEYEQMVVEWYKLQEEEAALAATIAGAALSAHATAISQLMPQDIRLAPQDERTPSLESELAYAA